MFAIFKARKTFSPYNFVFTFLMSNYAKKHHVQRVIVKFFIYISFICFFYKKNIFKVHIGENFHGIVDIILLKMAISLVFTTCLRKLWSDKSKWFYSFKTEIFRSSTSLFKKEERKKKKLLPSLSCWIQFWSDFPSSLFIHYLFMRFVTRFLSSIYINGLCRWLSCVSRNCLMISSSS